MKVFDKLKPGENPSLLSNQDLLDQLVDHFRKQAAEHSLRRRLLYPMMFYIFIHPDDWARRKDDLQFIILEIIDALYDVIHRLSAERPDYTPPAREWFFQFSELKEGTVATDNGRQVELQQPGRIHILSRLLAPSTSGVTTEAETRFSLFIKNSDRDAVVNINPQAIARIDKLGEGVIVRRFDPTLGGRVTPGDDTNTPHGVALPVSDTPVVGARPAPRIVWTQGATRNTCTIRDNYLIITNASDPMTGDHVLKIDSPYVATGHIRIVYEGDKDRYLVCAFAPAILNSRQLQVSTPDDPRYYPMSNRSRLILGDFLALAFEYPEQP